VFHGHGRTGCRRCRATATGLAALAFVGAPLAATTATGRAPEPAAHAARAKAHLSLAGMGKARFGMTFAQVHRAFGSRLRCIAGRPCVCAAVQYRPNVTLVFGRDRRLRLIAANNTDDGARVVTGRGLALGDSQARMKRLYPKSRRVGGGPRYRWTRGTRGYVWNFSEGPLTQIVAGYKSALLTDEFCG
jgi:hypothetical protein